MANNLDRLFRESLDQVEVTPSARSWDQVKNQLERKRPGWIIPLRIAAAVALVVTASLIVIYSDNSGSSTLISGMDHPAQAPAFSWQTELPNLETINKSESYPAKHTTVATTTKPSVATEQESNTSLETITTLSVVGLRTPILLDKEMITTKPTLKGGQTEPDQPKVKITYIAAEQKTAGDSTQAGKLSKVFALAKEVSSSDLLADIRDAKDNLFNRN